MTLLRNLKIILIFFCGFIGLSYGLLNPVILIPGDGGSQIEAKVNKTSVVHYICEKTSDYFNIWLNMELLVPVVIDCWIDNIKLVYNNITRTTSNVEGVDTRIPGFGGSETVEWLDPSHASTGAYFKDIANLLVNLGYLRNITIRGAPYDFRKAPSKSLFYTKYKYFYSEIFSDFVFQFLHSYLIIIEITKYFNSKTESQCFITFQAFLLQCE